MVKTKKEVVSEEVKKKMAGVDYVKLQEMIIENLVELQRVHTNMAEKFNKLSEQIASLLNLFELAARSFAEHPANQGVDKDKEFLEKIDRLLEQNKTIAKGLTLMEERVREKVYGPVPPRLQMPVEEKSEYEPSSINKPLPKF